MTSQTRRFAAIYAILIVALVAMSAIAVTMTQAGSPATAMIDISAVMGAIDTGSLPVQGHIDAI